MRAKHHLDKAFAVGAAMAVTLVGGSAFAGFWTPLDTVPQPNFIIGMDVSVTMGIRSDCSSCHSPGNTNTRLHEAKQDILATLPMFQNYFVFGGYRYAGCNTARVHTRTLPTPTNPPASYNSVRNMINASVHCNSRENNFPGAGSGTGCITPTPACTGDQPILQALMASGMPGLNIPPPAIPNPNVNLPCDTPSPPWPSYNLAASLLSKFAGFGWPRWDPASLNGAQVNNELCTPLSNVLNQVSAELSSCFTTTSSVWDMSFLGAGVGTWCTPGTIAVNACTPVSPLDGTCVCDDTLAGCASASIPNTECNKIMTWKARQQVGVCEMYSTAQPGRFGSYFLSQPDNIANGQCRENVGIFITDGYEGHKPGVAAEAVDAQNFYRSADGLSNLFLFHVSNFFHSDANTMQQYISSNQVGGPTPTAYTATDRATMQASFAKVLSRIYRGVYTGANMGTDRYQTRVAFHSFTVPGYNATGPVSDDYLGFPSRISVHAVDVNGNISAAPIYESDWASRVNAASACGGFTMSGSPGTPGYAMGGNDTATLGPAGQFANGIDRQVNVPANSTDRDGDDIADPHPSLVYGRSFGFAAGAPLIVDGPEEAISAADADEIGGMTTFMGDNAIRQRPRVVYYSDGGYVIGVHGGTYQAGGFTYGSQQIGVTYDDSAAPAGTEVLRYQPRWVNPANYPTLSYNYDYAANGLIQQPIMNGELIAKETFVRVSGNTELRTVLLGNQGKEGPGFFALDVSEPCSAPLFATDITLPPGDFASAEPTLYLMRNSALPNRRAVLVTTGGLGGSSNLYAYDIVTGAQVASVALPAQGGESYASAPVCVDVTGEGVITHCYALRTDGYLARAQVITNGFSATVQNVTPVDGSGGNPTMAAGRQYFTSPVAFFDSKGVVNIVFGSGDYQNLTSAPANNAVFRARDIATRTTGVPGGAARLDQTCVPVSGNTDGVIPLGAGERLLSKPVVSGGVVAWTTYQSTTNGCISGTGYLYAMDFEDCTDVLNPTNNRPASNPVGAGIPTSPVLHSQSETVLVQSSAGPTGGQVQTDQAQTRGGGQKWIKPLYWRMKVDNP